MSAFDYRMVTDGDTSQILTADRRVFRPGPLGACHKHASAANIE